MTPTTLDVESAEQLVERARLKWRNDTSGHKARYFREYVEARKVATQVSAEAIRANQKSIQELRLGEGN